jgi:hypothetical protein
VTSILAAVASIGGTAMVLAGVYFVFRRFQRTGRTLTIIDPRLPESLQGRPPVPMEFPPGRPYPNEDVSWIDSNNPSKDGS